MDPTNAVGVGVVGRVSPFAVSAARMAAVKLSILGVDLRLLRDGHEVPVPEGSRRLLGYLAVHDGTADRLRLSGTLWPDLAQPRASGNLRTCLWRLRGTGLPLVDTSSHALRLSDDVDVDYQLLVLAAQEVLERTVGDGRAYWRMFVAAHDVLEGWSEEWLSVPRERFRQLRLQALECLALTLAEYGWLGPALECAQAAVATDPLRESAHGVAIRIHLRQGNRTEALRQFRSYCRAMASELDLPPDRDLCDLVSGLGLPADTSAEVGLPSK